MIAFKFKDNSQDDAVDVQEQNLLEVLSMGERRALYILNIIFEFEARRELKQKTFFVIDDIADSFDYKNKYAIIEYLNDMLKDKIFYVVILTHNFDFYRTISSRLNLPGENRFHVAKTEQQTTLVKDAYQKNPFATWKKNLNNNVYLVASIPFARNLAEYCGINGDKKQLTSLLHIKPDTNTITVQDLEGIFKNIMKDQTGLTLVNPTQIVKDLIYSTADCIHAETHEVIELEKKIALSMAVRLKAEEFMLKEIADPTLPAAIKINQTIELIRKYKQKFSVDPSKAEIIQLMEQVNLMTPENIHLNSFMYEPILDMANDHLKKLYRDVSAL